MSFKVCSVYKVKRLAMLMRVGLCIQLREERHLAMIGRLGFTNVDRFKLAD